MLHKIMKFWGILVLPVIVLGAIGICCHVFKIMWLESPGTVLAIIFIVPPAVYFWLKEGS